MKDCMPVGADGARPSITEFQAKLLVSVQPLALAP